MPWLVVVAIALGLVHPPSASGQSLVNDQVGGGYRAAVRRRFGRGVRRLHLRTQPGSPVTGRVVWSALRSAGARPGGCLARRRVRTRRRCVHHRGDGALLAEPERLRGALLSRAGAHAARDVPRQLGSKPDRGGTGRGTIEKLRRALSEVASRARRRLLHDRALQLLRRHRTDLREVPARSVVSSRRRSRDGAAADRAGSEDRKPVQTAGRSRARDDLRFARRPR